MKILLINKFFYPRGGSETVFFETARLLTQAGNQVLIFSMKDEKNWPSDYSDYFVEPIDFSKREGFWRDLKKAGHYLYSTEAKRKLAALIKKTKPDIAHLHNISHQITPSILSVLRKQQIPVVQTLHDYQLICPNYHLFTQGKVCERCKKIKFYNAVVNKCLKNSYAASLLGCLELTGQRLFHFYKEKVDLFISPSGFLKNKLVEWGIKNKITVINNPIEIETIKPNYNVGEYLFCVSRFVTGKGLKTLIDAVKDSPEIKLKIAGDGPEFALMQKYWSKLNARNIELLGCQTKEQILQTLKSCRFFIMPSEIHENYPTVILEAFASGKPVLSSNVGGAPELVTENKTGWLFEAGNVETLKDKINNRWNQIEVIENLGRQARAFVEKNNNSQVYLEKLLEIYNELLNRTGQMG